LAHVEETSEGQSNGMFSPEEKDSRKINLSKIAEMNDDQAHEELNSARGE